MANPQAENGHLRIANEVWDHLLKAGLTGAEWDVLGVVLKKTWGWNQKEAAISLKQFCSFTARDGESIRCALSALKDRKLLIQINAATFTTPACWRFNKDWESWGVRGTPNQTESPNYTDSHLKN